MRMRRVGFMRRITGMDIETAEKCLPRNIYGQNKLGKILDEVRETLWNSPVYRDERNYILNRLHNDPEYLLKATEKIDLIYKDRAQQRFAMFRRIEHTVRHSEIDEIAINLIPEWGRPPPLENTFEMSICPSPAVVFDFKEQRNEQYVHHPQFVARLSYPPALCEIMRSRMCPSAHLEIYERKKRERSRSCSSDVTRHRTSRRKERRKRSESLRRDHSSERKRRKRKHRDSTSRSRSRSRSRSKRKSSKHSGKKSEKTHKHKHRKKTRRRSFSDDGSLSPPRLLNRKQRREVARKAKEKEVRESSWDGKDMRMDKSSNERDIDAILKVEENKTSSTSQ